MTSRPAKQESHREHQHTHLLQCQITQDRAENPQGRGGGGEWHQQVKSACQQSWPSSLIPGTHRTEGENWFLRAVAHIGTLPNTKCQRVREEKVDPESQSLIRAFADMKGSAAPTQSMEALPQAEHTPRETSQARLHKHSVRLTRLHLTWVRQDAGNVHITQSSPGLVERGQGLVYTNKG